jgi:hypothetical protein
MWGTGHWGLVNARRRVSNSRTHLRLRVTTAIRLNFPTGSRSPPAGARSSFHLCTRRSRRTRNDPRELKEQNGHLWKFRAFFCTSRQTNSTTTTKRTHSSLQLSLFCLYIFWLLSPCPIHKGRGLPLERADLPLHPGNENGAVALFNISCSRTVIEHGHNHWWGFLGSLASGRCQERGAWCQRRISA